MTSNTFPHHKYLLLLMFTDDVAQRLNIRVEHVNDMKIQWDVLRRLPPVVRINTALETIFNLEVNRYERVKRNMTRVMNGDECKVITHPPAPQPSFTNDQVPVVQPTEPTPAIPVPEPPVVQPTPDTAIPVPEPPVVQPTEHSFPVLSPPIWNTNVRVVIIPSSGNKVKMSEEGAIIRKQGSDLIEFNPFTRKYSKNGVVYRTADMSSGPDRDLIEICDSYIALDNAMSDILSKYFNTERAVQYRTTDSSSDGNSNVSSNSSSSSSSSSDSSTTPRWSRWVRILGIILGIICFVIALFIIMFALRVEYKIYT